MSRKILAPVPTAITKDLAKNGANMNLENRLNFRAGILPFESYRTSYTNSSRFISKADTFSKIPSMKENAANGDFI